MAKPGCNDRAAVQNAVSRAGRSSYRGEVNDTIFGYRGHKASQGALKKLLADKKNGGVRFWGTGHRHAALGNSYSLQYWTLRSD